MKLLKQNKTFHIRRRIPMDLKEYFPNKIYIARSLHTTDALFAKKKGEILNSTINNIFKAIRKQKSFESNHDNLRKFTRNLVSQKLPFKKKLNQPLNVCLIKIPTFEAPQSLSYFNSVPNLGLAYVAGAVREAGHNLQIIDGPGEAITKYTYFKTSDNKLWAHGLTMDEIVERIKPNTDVIGITNMFLHEWEFIYKILKLIKQKYPDITIVVGGETATAWWDYMLKKSPELDICAIGEGEGVMVGLLDILSHGKSLSNAGSIAYKKNNGEIAVTERMKRITNINDIPLPAWDLFPVDEYLKHEFGSGVNRGKSMPMLTSRGCPFQCTFCSSADMWTTRYFARDPNKVADEVEFYQKRYDVNNINFNDLTAVLTKKWIVEFCNVILDRKLKFSWQLPSGTRSEAVDFEAAKLLYNSGCRNFGYAPESGSPRVLEKIKKKVKIPGLITSLKSSLKADLKTHANIIVGFPEEKLKDLFYTYLLLLKMAVTGLHGASVMMFTPYPGSALYRELKSKKKIDIDTKYIYSTLTRSGASTKSYSNFFGTRFLIVTQWFFLLSFFSLMYGIRPLRLFKLLKNIIKKKQETVMDQFLVEKYKQLRRFFSFVN
tara:strand:+ start:86 stop:1894 length:1809 start_codon:yes stop_codon:yes gene_type:complete